MLIDIPPDWLPTSDNINSLPDPLKRFIMELETIADPAGHTQTIAMLRDQVEGLQAAMLDRCCFNGDGCEDHR